MQALDRLRRWRTDGTPPSVAPPELRRWWRTLQQGRLPEAVDAAPALAGRLAAEEATRGWVPAVVLATGAVLAGQERNLEARQHLREGLAMLPGTPSTDLVGDGSWHALVLVELCLLTGEPAEAAARVDPLTLPDRPVEVRLGAARAQARLRQATGDFEGAHWLLHTATDLAAATRSHLLETVVEADRAVLLARQGRTHEAVRVADGAVEPLSRPGQGPHAVLALGQAAATAASVARVCAATGDTLSAARLVGDAHRAADRSGRRLPRAGALLAEAATHRALGDLAAADAAAEAASRLAAELAAAPVEALARYEAGCAAVAAGRLASARPVLARAATELRRTGQPVDAAEVERLLAQLPI